MRTRNVVLATLFMGALAFAGLAGAQPEPAGGAGRPGGERGNRQGGQGQQRPRADAGNADRGEFNPEDMQQWREEAQKRYDERMKKAFDMTDIEWLTLDLKIQKVQAIQREIDMTSGANTNARLGRGAFGGMGGPMVAPDVRGTIVQEPQTELDKAMRELLTTLNNKDATPEQITASLQAVRDARARLPEELAAARADLLQGLTPRQEAQLLLMGVIQ